MNATRQGDCCTGHDACPPAPLVEYSSDVKINGLGAGRVGDHYASHGSSVFINGRPAARIGDAVSIGGSVQDGSGDVFIGG